MLTERNIVEHAECIAELASETARGYFRKFLDIEQKADDSPVTQADRGVEQRVRSYLEDHFPNDGVLGEEFGQSGLANDYVWSVDPIDGTRSFLSGHPLFGFLLARLHKGEPELGVIGMPALRETIVGERGGRATLNGKPVQVSKQQSLADAIIFVNEGEKLFESHPDIFSALVKAGSTRRFGYDCYPHALVAMGHVDAVVDFDLQPYDYLAIVPVIEAAGGVITDWKGNPLSLTSGTTGIVVAATKNLHEELLQLVVG